MGCGYGVSFCFLEVTFITIVLLVSLYGMLVITEGVRET